ADFGDAARQRLLFGLPRQHFGLELASEAAAADAGEPKDRDFLGEEIDDLEVVLEGDVLVAQGAGDFEGCGNAGDAIEAAALGDSVRVRADHDAAAAGYPAPTAADEIAGGVDLRFEPRRLEAADQIFATGKEHRGEGAARPRPVRLGDGGKVGNVLGDPGGVHR